ncbi:MAG: tetratricopeptide repeat protein [Pseudomonadota bacterium]
MTTTAANSVEPRVQGSLGPNAKPRADKRDTGKRPAAIPIAATLAATLLLTACAMTPDNLGLPASLAPDPNTSGIETGSIGNTAVDPFGFNPDTTPQNTADKSGTPDVLEEVARLRALNRQPEALALLEQATSKATATLAMRLSHGLLALEVGNLADARQILKKAAKSDPPNWRVLSGLGSVYAAEGKQSDAQKAFAQALRLKPDHPSILNNLALSYALDGKRDRAEAILRRAAADTTANPQAKQNLALLLGLEGRKKEASKFAEAVLPKPKADANLGYLEELRATVKISKDERAKAAVKSAARN